MTDRPDELHEHVDVLSAFERDYREYVDAQKRAEAGYSIDAAWVGARRSDLLRRAARAQRAVEASGHTFALTPPPAFGGPILENLAQQVFAHETPLYGGGSDAFMTADMVLDALANAIGALDDRVEQAEIRGRPVQRRASSAVRGHVPTLWGRVRHVPTWVGFAADVITVGTVLAAALKLLGLF